MSSCRDALHLESAVEVVAAGIVGDGQPVAGRRVQPGDDAAVVLAVGLEVIGAVVDVLCAAGHLLPDGYFIPLGALGGAIAGDGQATRIPH